MWRWTAQGNWKNLYLLSDVSADPNFDSLKSTVVKKKKTSSETPVGKSALLQQQKLYSAKDKEIVFKSVGNTKKICGYK